MGLIGLVHTTRLVVEPVHEAVTGAHPDISVSHVLDEGILRKLASEKRITPGIVNWLTSMVKSAEVAGADLAIVSCSSLSPCVNEVRGNVRIPVLKVDEPMVEYAVENAAKIGLVMTNPTTEHPSRMLFQEVSEKLSRKVHLVTRLCPDAFEKLNRGDNAGHDEEVLKTVEAMLEKVDLVMLAQISIARVKRQLSPSSAERVLSSLDFIGGKARTMLGI